MRNSGFTLIELIIVIVILAILSITAAPRFLSLYSEVVVADKGYDSQALREMVNSRNAKHVIPRKGNSKAGNDDIV